MKRRGGANLLGAMIKCHFLKLCFLFEVFVGEQPVGGSGSVNGQQQRDQSRALSITLARSHCASFPSPVSHRRCRLVPVRATTPPSPSVTPTPLFQEHRPVGMAMKWRLWTPAYCWHGGDAGWKHGAEGAPPLHH
ncbi:hypothetical protein ABL78_8490 [Leptomonas seymouri]|uniref:Secreted protein n=1 Tax=Leptomonas seymouri TaxID=5684 RepID=A0A0N1IH09_LEPSE|nr:hypothetical protein ABL78_8490 [Leptomonas seymouri]|eukprot:KPI82500.1 hypothetical protein ABL78_8490 [Leptomonas seymouri]